METMEFNLLQERWVRVRTQDCTVQEVSLTDALKIFTTATVLASLIALGLTLVLSHFV